MITWSVLYFTYIPSFLVATVSGFFYLIKSRRGVSRRDALAVPILSASLVSLTSFFVAGVLATAVALSPAAFRMAWWFQEYEHLPIIAVTMAFNIWIASLFFKTIFGPSSSQK